MGKKNRTQQNNGNQNNQNNAAKPAKKPGLFKKIWTWPSRHPKIVKGVKITATAVGGTLAAVGGAGLVMAVKDRQGKTDTSIPEMLSTPDIHIPEPGPVDYPTED